MKDREESYKSIVSSVREMYNRELTEVDVHTATRNLIEFVKILSKHNEKGN